ncbi:hypothetical protein A2960_05890 [Candidatus Gottesmanbacteria bacterium RIFCSPLOWO2_01_FULL_39_12b]|uniref:Uncharacterized protein n=1 Tax=Candidatus Gottesmanbacteria bacterium RIFCSPLOWO2_01_FULL_39_12b TaxID=1798388 RepID=A0A1F6AMZ9_9BACT|nr:MAG: hypothetical protein A2960_05890 [Candidatus Gottesmanbacteria bacterium RIFCSPLOWO2_01_FULL_39_12b]
MQKVGDILIKFNPLEDKYISREFQSYGYYLTEELNDLKHKGIYMKLSKNMPRALLEKALSFVKDANVKRKGALFMWKLKELGAWPDKKKSAKGRSSSGRKKIEDIPF